MSKVDGQKRKWIGVICPVCRFVMRVPQDTDSQGAVCFSCRHLLQLPPKVVNYSKLSVVEFEDDGSTGEYIISGEPYVISGYKAMVAGFVTLLVTFGVIMFMVINYMNREDDVSSFHIVKTQVEDEVKSLDNEIREADILKINIEQELTEIFERFLAVGEVSEFEQLIRNPELVMPKIRHYYDKVSLIPTQLSVKDNVSFSDLNHNTIDVEIRHEGIVTKATFFEKTSDGYVIDWESWVVWSDISWEDLPKQRPTTPVLVRANISVGYYYNGDFADDTKWLCLKMTHPSSEQELYGYVSFLSAPSDLLLLVGRIKQAKATLMVRYDENTTSKNQMLITDILYEGWGDKGDK